MGGMGNEREGGGVEGMYGEREVGGRERHTVKVLLDVSSMHYPQD